MLGANYKLGAFKLFGGYQRIETDDDATIADPTNPTAATRSNQGWVGANYEVTPVFSLQAGVYHVQPEPRRRQRDARRSGRDVLAVEAHGHVRDLRLGVEQGQRGLPCDHLPPGPLAGQQPAGYVRRHDALLLTGNLPAAPDRAPVARSSITARLGTGRPWMRRQRGFARDEETEMRFRVGIVGLSPSRGWAMAAHIPALRALADDYEIAGVANTSLESAKAAAQALTAFRTPSAASRRWRRRRTSTSSR